MKLNREQLLSIYSEGNLSITANAGSGKTSILTQKYVHTVLSQNLEPENIIAITFTKKAAAEMKSRIKKEFNKKLIEEKDPIIIRKINRALSSLSKASISTIHSLALKIIDEDPHKIGLAPGFNEISEVELRKFIHDQIYLELQKLLAENDSSIIKLLSFLNLNTIIEILKNLITNNYTKPSYSRIDIDNIYNQFKNQLSGDLIKIYSILAEAFKKVKDNKKYQDKIDKYKLNIDNILKILNTDSHKIYSENLELIRTTDKVGSLKICTFLKKSYDLPIDFQDILDSTNNLLDLLIAKNDYLLFELTEILLNIKSNIQEKVDDFKIELNALDFSDQLIFANKVLEDESAIKSFARNIKLIMVDEFQDTDQLQYNIVKKIWKNTNCKLFVVGDEKQSIYSFRNADVRIFKNLKNEIAEENKKSNFINDKTFIPNNKYILKASEEKKGIINLNTSYRMSKELAVFINYVTNKIFNSSSEYDVISTPIQSTLIHQSIDKPLEFLLGNNGDIHEADLVTNKIIELTNNYKLAEICILSRKKTKFSELTSRLIKKRIPYQLHSEENYLNTEEISDIIYFLDYLNGNNSKYNQIAILKSFLFGLSDTDILNLISINEKNLFEGLNESENEFFNKIYSFINAVEPKVNRVSLPDLIQYILDYSCWDNIIINHINVDSIKKNTQRFIKEVIEFSTSRFKSLNDLVSYLKLMKESKTNSGGEIKIDPEKINIMTVHGSKGLEFKCVILYDSHGKSSNNSRSKICETDKFKPVINFKDKKGVSSILETENKKILQEKDNAEEKRMLYVALTRAIEKLIISANVKINKDGSFPKSDGTFMQYLYNVLKPDGFDLNDPKNVIHIEDRINILENDNISQETLSIDIPIIYEVEDLEYSSGNKKYDKKYILNEQILDTIKYENITASKLNYLNKDLSYFRDRYIYGLPEDYDNFFRGNFHKIDSDEDEILSSEKGEIIHNILEFIPDFIDNNAFNSEKVNSKIDQVLTERNRTILNDQISEIIWKVLDSDYILENIAQLQNLETEKSLKMPFGEDILTGYIDAIFKDKNGNYQIWDWKSNSIDNINQAGELIDFYNPQLRLYSYFLSFINPEQVNFEAKLLFVKLAGKNSSEKEWIHTFTFTKEDLKEFERTIKESTKKIRSVYFN